MPNIPTRQPISERTVQSQRPVQNNVQRPMPPQQRSTQDRAHAQPQRNRIPAQQMRYGHTEQMHTQNSRSASERIKPIQPPKSTTHKTLAATKSSSPARKKKNRKKRERTTLGDFLLSFFVALFVFGVAAIFVCNALISLFT